MELRMSEQFTRETGSSLLPTPQVFDSIPPDKRIKNSKIIVQENGRTVKVNPNGVKWTADLLTTVIARQMLPTPTANDAKNNGSPSNWRRNSLPLNTIVLLATPTASQDYKAVRPLSPSEANGTHGKTLVGDVGNQLGVEIGESGESERLYLNPEFVETMMGFPIGWTSIEPND